MRDDRAPFRIMDNEGHFLQTSRQTKEQNWVEDAMKARRYDSLLKAETDAIPLGAYVVDSMGRIVFHKGKYPCKGCVNRKEGCHGWCVPYQMCVAENARNLKMQTDARIADSNITEHIIGMREKRKRCKHE